MTSYEETTFQGKRYKLIPFNIPPVARGIHLRGELPHVGSLRGTFVGMSQPQVYKDTRGLIAVACSCRSQFVDRFYTMLEIR